MPRRAQRREHLSQLCFADLAALLSTLRLRTFPNHSTHAARLPQVSSRRVSVRPNVAGSAPACPAERPFYRFDDVRIYFRMRARPANFIVEDVADHRRVTKDAPGDGQADGSLRDSSF